MEGTEELTKLERQLKDNFDKFYDNFKIESGATFKELAWLFYKQGHLDQTPTGVDLDESKFMDEYQRDAFIKFVEECIENPASTTEASQNEYALVEYKCPGHDKCIAWPDRCEDVGGDGQTCTTLINLSKLCGIESSSEIHGALVDKRKMLTTEEAKVLANIVGRLNMEDK